VSTPATLGRWNPNLIGSYILGGSIEYSTAPLSPHPIAVSYSEKRAVFVRSIYPARRWSARDDRISCSKNCFDRLEIVKSLAWIATSPREVFITLSNDLEKIIAGRQ
jgi:hypothetical protein